MIINPLLNYTDAIANKKIPYSHEHSVDKISKKKLQLIMTTMMIVISYLLLLSSSACAVLGVGVRPKNKEPVRPEEPILVRPSAKAVVGRTTRDILIPATRTTAKIQLDSETIKKVVKESMPAVVSIYTETATPYKVKLFPIPLPGIHFQVNLPGKALGSAFFVHPSGYLLTNNHVIEDAQNIEARTADGKEYDIIMVARDPALDIALLRVSNTTRRFPYIPFGNSDEVDIGDVVIAIGNPLGLGHTVTHGIISQTGRHLVEREEREARGGRYIAFLQSDAALNPGSSGGPLITLTGAVIGINTAVIQGAQGISFTVPSKQVKEFVRQVIAGQGSTESETQ